MAGNKPKVWSRRAKKTARTMLLGMRISQMEKEGFGEEFSICSSFCFGGIRGGQN